MLSIEDKNKLIDEFNDNFLFQRGFSYSEMNYSSDWNMLMPVVEKIESINSINDEYYSNYTFTVTNFIQNWTANFIDRNNTEIVTEEGETRIEAVYNAVVEFIQWYNENKN